MNNTPENLQLYADALANKPAQEPVDVARVQADGYSVEWRPDMPHLPIGTKLYTHYAPSIMQEPTISVVNLIEMLKQDYSSDINWLEIIALITNQFADNRNMVKPIAYMGISQDGQPNKFRLNKFWGAIPLYTHPAPAKPLSKDEIYDLYDGSDNDFVIFARAIERAHGIV